MIFQIVLKLGALLVYIGEVDEEPGAHISLQFLGTVTVVVGRVVAQQQVAVLEQPTSPDFLRIPGDDQLVLQVVHGISEVTVHRLTDHGRVEAFADRHATGTLVKQEQRVEHDLERVDAELERPLHSVDKLELDIPLARQRAQRYKRPPITVLVHFDHFANVCLFDAARRHSFATDTFRQQINKCSKHG